MAWQGDGNGGGPASSIMHGRGGAGAEVDLPAVSCMAGGGGSRGGPASSVVRGRGALWAWQGGGECMVR